MTEDNCLFCAKDKEENGAYLRNQTCYVRFSNEPLADGHSQIVPIRHTDSFFGLTQREVDDVHKMLVMARDALDFLHRPDGWWLQWNEGLAEDGGHLYINLVPRRAGGVR